MVDRGSAPVAVVMAGGRGQRFWPLSTERRPKQFLDVRGDGTSLLQATCARLVPVVGSWERLVVATGHRYLALVRDQLPRLPHGNIVVEPTGRDSAPAIALAALHVRARFGNPVMGVFASDHHVDPPQAFTDTVLRAVRVASDTRSLVALAIPPTRAATAYGYLERGEPVGEGFRITRFVEKPQAATARQYLESGRYLWNAGMFAWQVDVIVGELLRHSGGWMESLVAAFEENTVEQVFPTLPKISIDYAVMERSDRAVGVEATFAWDDVGDWVALERLLPEVDRPARAIVGRHAGHDTAGNVVFTDGDDDVMIVLGVEGLVVVKRGNAVLVAPKDRIAEVKSILDGDERLSSWEPDAD